MKLRTKLILLLLILTMLPLSLLAWLSYQNSKDALKDTIGNELISVTQGTMYNIEQELLELYKNVRSWAYSEIMQEVLTDDADGRITSVLSGFKRNYMVYAGIYCFNQKGEIIASSNPDVIGKSYPDNPRFKGAMAGKTIIHDLKFSDLSQAYTVDFAVPITDAYDSTNTIGVLLAELNQKQLDDIIRFSKGPQIPSSHALLINREGFIIAGSVNERSPLSENILNGNQDVRHLVSLNKTGYTIGMYEKREWFLYGYAPQKGFGSFKKSGCAMACHNQESQSVSDKSPENFPSLGWGVLALKPAKEAFKPVVLLERQILSLGIVIFLITTILLTTFIVRIVINPIQELAEGSQKFAAGKLDYRVKIKRTDEIGKLAVSFNQMAEGLESSMDRLEKWGNLLEQKVKERTSELAKAYEEVKSTQNQLVQSGKMAAVGELGAGVAHELNNPLTGILGYAQYILDKTKKPDFTPDDSKVCARQIEYIEKEAQRCKNIVQNLLKFSRKSHDKFEPLNVNNVIEDTLALVGHQLAMNNITLIKELEPDLKDIIGNANQLQQVFTNIILNAHQAMSDKGELRIGTRNKDGSIEIEFTDTGCGIPEENLNKIFDPFFTTKKDWRGTGLGLSISYKIIQDHKGSISVQSEVDKGTTFIITLPV